MHNFTLFSPNLHAPCTARYTFCFFFVIGFNFIRLFNLSLLDLCTCYFCFTSWLSVTLASFSFFNISKLCVCSLFQFLFIFYFPFWVLCGSQCHSWNDIVLASYYSVWASTSSLWSCRIFGVLDLQSPSIFHFYVSVSLLKNHASNLQQCKTSSSFLFPTNWLHRYDSWSFNKYYSELVHGICLMISFMSFGVRLGDGGRGVDDKSVISFGFGFLLSKISNLIFYSSLQNFRHEFVHHSCWRALGHGNFRFDQFLTLNTRFTLHLICLFAHNHRGFDFSHYDFQLP